MSSKETSPTPSIKPRLEEAKLNKALNEELTKHDPIEAYLNADIGHQSTKGDTTEQLSGALNNVRLAADERSTIEANIPAQAAGISQSSSVDGANLPATKSFVWCWTELTFGIYTHRALAST